MAKFWKRNVMTKTPMTRTYANPAIGSGSVSWLSSMAVAEVSIGICCPSVPATWNKRASHPGEGTDLSSGTAT